MTASLTLTITVDNVYDGDTITTTSTETVAFPEPGEDLEDWAADELLPFTGTGRPDGDAYFLTITACAERPDLVGRTFEWGV